MKIVRGYEAGLRKEHRGVKVFALSRAFADRWEQRVTYCRQWIHPAPVVSFGAHSN